MTKKDEIHQLIDTRIRQKTLDGSIQKTDVADSLDAIADALFMTAGSVKFGADGTATIPPNTAVTEIFTMFNGALLNWQIWGSQPQDSTYIDYMGAIGTDSPSGQTMLYQRLGAVIFYDKEVTFHITQADGTPIPPEATVYLIYFNIAGQL